MCMHLSYLSFAVNIRDQGYYRRVHWGLTVSEDESVSLNVGEHGSKQACSGAVVECLVTSNPEV